MNKMIIVTAWFAIAILGWIYVVSALRRRARSGLGIPRPFASLARRRWSWILLGLAGLLAATAGAVGINDNLPGILLAFAAVAVAAVALVNPSGRAYEVLLLVGCIGLISCGLLHNLLEALATAAAGVPVLRWPLVALSVTCFLLAVLVSPPLIVVGAAGAALFQGKKLLGRIAGS